jgi:hypothetical protein
MHPILKSRQDVQVKPFRIAGLRQELPGLVEIIGIARNLFVIGWRSRDRPLVGNVGPAVAQRVPQGLDVNGIRHRLPHLYFVERRVSIMNFDKLMAERRAVNFFATAENTCLVELFNVFKTIICF